MFEYITARILHTPLGKRVDELLAKVQAIDSPDQPQSDSPSRSPSLSNMLSEMSTHSRRIQNRMSLESPRSRSRATARHSSFAGPPSVPSQESILYSLYVVPISPSGVLDRNHRFPTNAIPCPRRSLRRRPHPPPVYSETDPNASISATLSEMGLCVRGDVPPRLPPPYASLPVLPAPVDG